MLGISAAALTDVAYWSLRLLDSVRAPIKRSDRLIIGGMATMPSRSRTFPRALASAIRQVDHLYVYLDGHDQVPREVAGNPRITTIRAWEFPRLHAYGKFLPLVLDRRDFTFFGFDDDIQYCHNYVDHLAGALERYGNKAVIGVHGRLLPRPFTHYNDVTVSLWYKLAQDQDIAVDILGSGASAFCSTALRFDARSWRSTNMADLSLAIEAAKAGVPMICVARPARLALPLSTTQPDSIYARLLKDDSGQTELAKDLLAISNRAQGYREGGA